MILKSIEYDEFGDEPNQWMLTGFTLGSVNLIVGKNATGKSRSLNVIHGLAQLVCGKKKLTFRSGTFKLEFASEEGVVVYELELKDAEVHRESYVVNGNNYLLRTAGGAGEIWAEKLRTRIEFQSPVTELAVVARQDSIQHPFLTQLYDWGKALRLFRFGTHLGKNNYTIIKETKGDDVELSDADQVVGIFLKGRSSHDPQFSEAIIKDMDEIGYPIQSIGTSTPWGVTFSEPIGDRAVGLFVKETTLAGRTEQNSMSQGMFRALSVIVQLNYSYLASRPSCVLIDDIGEGLDFERSSALIKLLVRKAKHAGVQLVMTTNDRFVMNNVPLEMWSVLQRDGGHCRVYNFENSRQIFDEFKFTGLNNFDFLAADFLNAKCPPDA